MDNQAITANTDDYIRISTVRIKKTEGPGGKRSRNTENLKTVHSILKMQARRKRSWESLRLRNDIELWQIK
ncbi:hypothetical protein CY34DRAFT_291016 [Suillus luteus UH-Slu-Lm8-n1]|uniref:Uncharacterized protein n=1 Tax=Suillus luteus UH-Slu-Lm8-n1 TaxID=930992 RepID=A0A0D0APU8_9AGAM|nr:hypothetical protein CY34DRAFT_291016 [Suillus luteus UH-Slu-Lm8-n1]